MLALFLVTMWVCTNVLLFLVRVRHVKRFPQSGALVGPFRVFEKRGLDSPSG